MSTMLLSLLIKVRSEGDAAIAKLREGLRESASRAQHLGVYGGMVGASFIGAAIKAREFAGAVAGAAQQARQLTGTLVHGTFGAAALTYAFKKSFLDIAVEAEKHRTRLEAIEGSEGRGEAAMAWTKAFRTNTATTLADVREAWIDLRTSGINPLRGAMQAIADTAAAQGKTMASIAQTFGEIIHGGGNSRAAMRDLGIEVQDSKTNAANLVLTYRHLGQVITKEIPKANKALLEQTLITAMLDKYSGAALKSAKGWPGLIASMSESWSKFALEVMDKGGVFQHLKAKFDEFILGGKKGAEGQADSAQSMAGVLKETISMVFEILTALRDGLPGFLKTVKEIVAAIGGWKVAMAGIVAILSAPFVMSLIGVVGATLGLAKAIFLWIVPALALFASALVSTVLPALKALSVALLTTPAGWVILAIAALITAAWLLYENWAEVSVVLVAVWKRFTDSAGAAWANIQGNARGFVILAQQLMSAWEPVGAFFAELWDSIAAKFNAVYGPIKAAIDEVKSWLPSLGASAAGGGGGAGKVEGASFLQRVAGAIGVEITVKGDAEARVTRSQMTGGLNLDTGLIMVSP